MKQKKKRKTVFVATSGGVDSSVAAALLCESGYDVVGVYMKGWEPPFIPCQWVDERRDAMRVCAVLGIPFLTFDFSGEYQRLVLDTMIAEYRAGRTPNPDVLCNKHLKFGLFAKRAENLGAEYIATGHHARIKKVKNRYQLYTAKDIEKDQSYFLWTLSQDILKKTLFPCGEYMKKEVRALARKCKLPTAEKKDSQGLCFVGKLPFKEFLAHYLPKAEGHLVTKEGECVGTHKGAHLYTLGERHGLSVTKRGAFESPYYVVGKDSKTNTLVVAQKKIANAYSQREILLASVNWIAGRAPDLPLSCEGRMRYRARRVPCTIREGNGCYRAVCEKSNEGATPGQSLVLYRGAECIGGGVIAT